MIKKFQIELIFLVVVFASIFVSYDVDIGFYYFFNNYNASLQNNYLKEFFKDITTLGDSKWYFLLSFFFLVLFYLNKNKAPKKANSDLFKSIGLYFLISQIVTGVVTQVIKHVVGRPRPNYSELDGSIVFSFFNLSSEFHSFPSGHSSAIFAAAIVAGLFFSKIKYFFIFVASIVAFSRVVVGAHFLTDVLGGIVVAYIGTKITVMFFKKYFISSCHTKNSTDFNNFTLVVLVFFCLAIITALGPSIDMYISGLFYYGDKQFLLQSWYGITIFFRKGLLPLIIFYTLILPLVAIFFPIKKIFFEHGFSIKDVLFIWSATIFNNLIVVNLFLKNYWGRPRPGDILELGGKESFVPWYQLSDSCSSNCSFVSGDASVGFSIIILYFLTKSRVFLLLSLAFGCSLGFIRIMEGGHFFSDILMAGMILYLCFYFQTKYYITNYAKN